VTPSTSTPCDHGGAEKIFGISRRPACAYHESDGRVLSQPPGHLCLSCRCFSGRLCAVSTADQGVLSTASSSGSRPGAPRCSTVPDGRSFNRLDALTLLSRCFPIVHLYFVREGEVLTSWTAEPAPESATLAPAPRLQKNSASASAPPALLAGVQSKDDTRYTATCSRRFRAGVNVYDQIGQRPARQTRQSGRVKKSLPSRHGAHSRHHRVEIGVVIVA